MKHVCTKQRAAARVDAASSPGCSLEERSSAETVAHDSLRKYKQNILEKIAIIAVRRCRSSLDWRFLQQAQMHGDSIPMYTTPAPHKANSSWEAFTQVKTDSLLMSLQ